MLSVMCLDPQQPWTLIYSYSKITIGICLIKEPSPQFARFNPHRRAFLAIVLAGEVAEMAARILRCSTEVLTRLATFLSGNTLQDQALEDDDSYSDQEQHYYARPSQLLTAMLLQEARNRGLVAVPQNAPSPPSHDSTADQRVLKPGATACRVWTKQGSCNYGAACHFRHDAAPKPDAAPPLPKLKEGNVDYALLSSDAVVNHPHFLASSECHRHLSTDREGRLFFRLTKIDHEEDDPFESKPHGLTEWTAMCRCPYQQPASCAFLGGVVELQRLVAVHCDVRSVLTLSTTCRGLHFLSHELAQQEEVLLGITLPAWQHKMPLSYRRRARCRSTLFGSPHEASRHGGIIGEVDAEVQGTSCSVRESCLTNPGHEAVAVLQVPGDLPSGDRVGSYGHGGDGEIIDYFCCSPTQTAALQMAWRQRVKAQADSPCRCPLSCEHWDRGVHAMKWIAGKRYKCDECKTKGPPGHRWRCGACDTAQKAYQSQYELCSPCGDAQLRRDQIEVGKLLAVAAEAVAAGEGMFVFISGGDD